MPTLAKDWDQHVVEAEQLARCDGFRQLRDEILSRAEPRSDEAAVDVGSGTGLLTLALAPQVERVWSLDISPAMCEYLEAKAGSAGQENVTTAVASAISLPLVDGAVGLAVSNYCFHHLRDGDKRRALVEAYRVLAPGGRLVFGDMMFRPALTAERDRRVVRAKVRAMLRKGPAGVLRVAKNGARFATGRWEKPARPDWWETALAETGFVDVSVEPLPHEGGLASARKP